MGREVAEKSDAVDDGGQVMSEEMLISNGNSEFHNNPRKAYKVRTLPDRVWRRDLYHFIRMQQPPELGTNIH